MTAVCLLFGYVWVLRIDYVCLSLLGYVRNFAVCAEVVCLGFAQSI